MIYHRDARLESIGEAVFDLGIEIESVVFPLLLARAQGGELINFKFTLRQRLRPADETEELFVCAQTGRRGANENYYGRRGAHPSITE